MQIFDLKAQPEDPGAQLQAAVDAGEAPMTDLAIHKVKEQGQTEMPLLFQCLEEIPLYLPGVEKDPFESPPILAAGEGDEEEIRFCMFTTPAKAEVFMGEEKETHPMLYEMPFRTMLYSLAPKVGILLNPQDEAFEFDIEPRNMEALREIYREAFQGQPGGIYLLFEGGVPRLAKVLARDEDGVHVRLYSNVIQELTGEVKQEELEESGEGSLRFVSHMPFSLDRLLTMNPLQVGQGTVEERELTDYENWKKGKGEYL